MEISERERITDELWNSYLYPNTDVLKNKLGIMDSEELRKREAEVSFERLVELYEKPIHGEFDSEHLKSIHKYIFGDLYDWAGEYRYVNMMKQTGFTNHKDIANYLENEFKLMHEELKAVTNESSLASFLATYYAQLMTIHPFREGNGRASREFLREFVLEKSKNLPCGQLELDWTKFNGEEMMRDIQFSLIFRGVMEYEFRKALIPVSIGEQTKM